LYIYLSAWVKESDNLFYGRKMPKCYSIASTSEDNPSETYPWNWTSLLPALLQQPTVLKQDRQYTYNIILRHVCATFVAAEKQIYSYIYTLWVYVHNLKYPACHVHAPCHLWPVWVYNMFFPHYLIKSMIFKTNKKKWYWMYNVCFGILCDFRLQCFSLWKVLSNIW
jgi:hypothetical protein